MKESNPDEDAKIAKELDEKMRQRASEKREEHLIKENLKYLLPRFTAEEMEKAAVKKFKK